MNIKNEGQTEAEFYQCANCHLLTTLIKTKILYSRLCLHRLCETCYKKLFTPENPIYKCNFCQRTHEPKDFSDKSKEEMYYEYDFRTRHKIMGVYYKRPEDFDSEDEYNDYLEEIEDKCKNKFIRIFFLILSFFINFF
jgi:CDK-activating kinase assembly factor MAT1